MTFWSGATLQRRLSEVVKCPSIARIDCAAYTLSVGPEFYVTPSDKTLDAKTTTIRKLDADEVFSIPAGQFGYILTEEVITIPDDVLAFISIKARIKWRGLVNVSGFHVDPGYHGRLLFAVYNAGPTSIHLRRGDPTFLIWFADLDAASTGHVKAHEPRMMSIDTNALNQVAGEIYSVQGLSEKIKATDKDLSTRVTALERANGTVKVAAALVITFIAAITGQYILKNFITESSKPVVEVDSQSSAKKADRQRDTNINIEFFAKPK
jgi:dCTP deaminase